MSSPHDIHEHRPEEKGRGGTKFRWIAVAGAAAYGLWRWWRRGKADDRSGVGVSPEESQRGHVPSERLSFGGVTGFAVGLLVLIGAVLGAAALLVSDLGRPQPNGDPDPSALPRQTERLSREAPLQADPAVDLLSVRRREHRQLTGYAWVDTSGGIVSIPIELAMEIIALSEDTVSSSDTDAVRILTESGFVDVRLDVAPPGSPPYLGGGEEPYTVSPSYARRLGLIDTNSEQE